MYIYSNSNNTWCRPQVRKHRVSLASRVYRLACFLFDKGLKASSFHTPLFFRSSLLNTLCSCLAILLCTNVVLFEQYESLGMVHSYFHVSSRHWNQTRFSPYRPQFLDKSRCGSGYWRCLGYGIICDFLKGWKHPRVVELEIGFVEWEKVKYSLFLFSVIAHLHIFHCCTRSLHL